MEMVRTLYLFLRGKAGGTYLRFQLVTNNFYHPYLGSASSLHGNNRRTRVVGLVHPRRGKKVAEEDKRDMGKSKQQILESRKRLFKVKATSDEQWVVQQHHLCTDWMSDVVNRGGDPCEQVTSIRVTSDDRENKRRIEEEARRQELRGKLLAEAEHRFAYLLSHEVIRHGKIVYGATGHTFVVFEDTYPLVMLATFSFVSDVAVALCFSARRNATLAMRWADLFSVEVPQDLFEEIEKQRTACDKITASKDRLISEVKNELKAKDDEYVKALKRQAEDIENLLTYMGQQFHDLQNAFEEELKEIDESFFTIRVDRAEVGLSPRCIRHHAPTDERLLWGGSGGMCCGAQERKELLDANKAELTAMFDRRSRMEQEFMEKTQERAQVRAPHGH
eukprot:1186944-Prorocentrum_minimum.AAC.1